MSFNKWPKISRKDQLAVVVTHPDFKYGDNMINIHAMKWWFVVDKEGNKYYFFDAPDVAYQDRAIEVPEEAQRAHVLPVVLEICAQMEIMTANKVATVATTTNFDDNNAPAHESIPQPNEQHTNGIIGEWGHVGICERRCLNSNESNARIHNFPEIATPTMLQIFEIFIPVGYVKEVMLPDMQPG